MAKTNVRKVLDRALEVGGGVLRLAPTWVPRSFLTPGLRLKLAPEDIYALGMDRGGIDERWFASTTVAANPGAPPDEGLSYIVSGDDRILLRDAVEERGPELVGAAIWKKYKRWPVYSKFFDNMGPIPHHIHLSAEQAALVGQEGKPESYYFPPQLNATGNNFPHTYFGLEPGVTRADVRRCLERWNRGDNGILGLSRAYRLEPGTGWFVPTRTLHAPGSLVTYEPQWGSDVFAMYQSLVEGRPVPWELLTKDVPPEKHHDLDYLVDMLDFGENGDPQFRANHWLPPVAAAGSVKEGCADRWVCYGRQGEPDLFSAKELTVNPGVKVKIKDGGACGLVTTQGHGRIGKVTLDAPNMIRYGEMTEDEVFVTDEAARAGVVFENTSPCEPLVTLRYFGPGASPDAPRLAKARA